MESLPEPRTGTPRSFEELTGVDERMADDVVIQGLKMALNEGKLAPEAVAEYAKTYDKYYNRRTFRRRKQPR